MTPATQPVVVDEFCRGCGLDSRYMHPAGVISRRWTCSRCGLRQDEHKPQQPSQLEED